MIGYFIELELKYEKMICEISILKDFVIKFE